MTSGAPILHWLPVDPEWRTAVRSASRSEDVTWQKIVALANNRLDFLATTMLDGVLQRHFSAPPAMLATNPIRLAVLGSSTLTHLHAGIRVAGVRRGLHITTYDGDFGQYRQELADPSSGLHRFAPTAILFALDSRHLTAGIGAAATQADARSALDAAKTSLISLWRQARAAFGCRVLQQTAVPVFDNLLGSNEHRLHGSRADFIRRLNDELREAADAEGVDLVAIDRRAGLDGLDAWYDAGLWHRSKQEISPAASPMYGELVARVLAAQQGRSYKCLVLDLDNTLWGGVIGDDGIAGVQLGQGSAAGEAFVAVQDYAKALAARGVILAVVSKNDEANALEAFERHPEMVLRRDDIAAFVANWSDKATNIRAVANTLNIGLDSLVFLDDNPFERNLVRQELPMVAVPEVPDDPALFPRVIADAGYFEGVGITAEDLDRGAQYQGNLSREAERAVATDLPAYLRSLDMILSWRRFDREGLPRVVQLINKTNQFNLTTRRYGHEEVDAMVDDERIVGLQFRLQDKFGDNGVIAIVIGRLLSGGEMAIDSWLMSCRVLGRDVEAATLNVLAEQAAALGASRLVGDYLPTAKNGMVHDLYTRLGFSAVPHPQEGASRHALSLENFRGRNSFVTLKQG